MLILPVLSLAKFFIPATITCSYTSPGASPLSKYKVGYLSYKHTYIQPYKAPG